MSELIESVATQLRIAADKVEESAVREGWDDDFHDEGDGMVMVSIEAMTELRHALNRCMGKPAFYRESSNG